MLHEMSININFYLILYDILLRNFIYYSNEYCLKIWRNKYEKNIAITCSCNLII